MADIIRIVIKGGSGYGPVDEAFSDKVTIDRDSIRYEYTPVVESEINIYIYIGNGHIKPPARSFRSCSGRRLLRLRLSLTGRKNRLQQISALPHSQSHIRIKPRPQEISSFRAMISKSALPLSSRWCRGANTRQRYFLHRTTTRKKGEKQALHDTF